MSRFYGAIRYRAILTALYGAYIIITPYKVARKGIIELSAVLIEDTRARPRGHPKPRESSEGEASGVRKEIVQAVAGQLSWTQFMAILYLDDYAKKSASHQIAGDQAELGIQSGITNIHPVPPP